MFKIKLKGWIITSILAIVFMVPSTQTSAQRKSKKTKAAPASGQFELNEKMTNMLSFRSLGPAAYSGRISDLAVNPENTSEYYVGVASGGLWKTIDGGDSWNISSHWWGDRTAES